MHVITEYLWLVPPGVCVLLLGVEALIITLIPSRLMEKRAIKVMGVLFCFVLAIGEIVVIKHDRNETLQQHSVDIKGIFSRFVKLDQDMVALQRTGQVQQAAISAYNVRPSISPTDSLRQQTLNLANEILRFLVTRELPPSGFGQGGFGEMLFGGGKPSQIQTYDRGTVAIYQKRFAGRVRAIRDQLRDLGLGDEQLDTEYASPNLNTYSIREIAERLTALAERFPDQLVAKPIN